ncbi:MAG: DAK2 domain-containing protein [Bauldia sp.]|uniref:DAK2 domain-containing protein n=1 Tax=Bauldia sp. TaxID=2575872 RepID=UPI001D5BA094|nr:DAK2 domain-containing protein [Bauldia sp.]MCB1495528.1 DAK2 domain-containing protein [Bauldia sp.]
MPLTVDTIRFAIDRISKALETEAPGLTEIDGTLGDGDLGITLDKAFRALSALSPELPDTLGQAFGKCAGEVNKASSSSYGTLMATALLASGKFVGPQPEMPWEKMSELGATVLAALQARGRASLGDKTVLDTVNAVVEATAGESDPDAMLAAARARVAEVLDEFRDKPNKIGRARIFAERSIGLDDPGMVAFSVMINALADQPG